MKDNKEVIFLIGLGLFLNSYAITWGLPNINDWTNLSLAPLKPLSYAKHLLAHETWLYHYPPFHFIVLLIAYSPYILYLLLTGGLSSPSEIYPYGLANPEFSLTIFTLTARFVSVAMGVGIIVVNYYAIRKFYDHKAAFISALLIATSYPLIHYSHSANVDVPQLFWFSLCLYCLVSLIHEPKAKYYVLLGLFVAFAVTTKESIYAAFVGMAIVILCVHFIRNYKSRNSIKSGIFNLVDLRVICGLVIFAVVTLLVFNPITNWEGFIFHIDRHALRSVRGSWVIRDAPSKIQGHIELVYHYMVYIFQSGGPLVFIFLIAGFMYCLVKEPARSAVLIIPMITYYIFFLRIHGTYHLRYMLPIYLMLMWFPGKLFSDLLSSKSSLRYVGWVLIPVVLLYSLLYGSSANTLYVNDPRYNAEKWISQNISSESIVLAIEPEYSLPRLPMYLTILKRNIWDFNGNLIDDLKDIDADYIVVGLSIPRRREQKESIEKFFEDSGYHEVISFQGQFSFIIQEIPNIHVLNPKITVLRKSTG